jgi:hypothetical protein
MMAHRPVLAALTAIWYGLCAHAAAAQSLSDPFGDPETSRPPEKKSAVPEAPRRPLLAPMDGRIPDGSPPSSATAPASTGSQYGTPYAPPASQPANSEAARPTNREFNAAPASDVVREPLPMGPLGREDRSIERADLAPVMAGGEAGLPYESWQGLSLSEIEALFASLEIPPRSPALHGLWMRLITSGAASPAGGENDARMSSLRAEALDRSGFPELARDVILQGPHERDAIATLILARTSIALGDDAQGCPAAATLVKSTSTMQQRLKAEAIVLTGYCAAKSGNPAGAGVAAELARESGMDGAAGPDFLDAMASGAKPAIPPQARLSLVDYQMLQPVDAEGLVAIIPNAVPALRRALAQSTTIDPAARLAAAEAATAVNVITVEELASAYRGHAATVAAAGDVSSLDTSETADLGPRRAAMFRSIEAERTLQKRARLIRAFLDSARRAQFYWPALKLMDDASRTIEPVPEIGWFAETAIEIALVAGRHEDARAWVAAGSQAGEGASGDFSHWLVLIDIADASRAGPGPGAVNLDSVDRFTPGGRFEPALLHRLATVLDALGTHIPIPLWEAASRTPQPADGHLPDTGVLSSLQTASKNKEFGHTVLLAMKALGPAGAEGAHMIALGDSIRALRRAGLEKEARELGLEALFASWPRVTSY